MAYLATSVGLRSVLEESAAADGARDALLFRGPAGDRTITRAELDRMARAVAGVLQGHAAAGDRVLVVCPAGVEYAAAMLGCLYAGVVAVPSQPPSRHRRGDSAERIARDAEPSLVLTAGDAGEAPTVPGASRVDVSEAMRADDELYHPTEAAPEDLAYLQYTSGSTSDPRGVRITHACLLANLACLTRRCEFDSDSVMVSWMPLQHDFGLVAGLLLPLYAGAKAVCMPPTSFVAQPLTWLEAIHDHEATHSGAPCFGYELVLRKAPADAIERLDLSRWRVAACGAEAIHSDLLDRVADALRPARFERRALCPTYGLAETTLNATCVAPADDPRTLRVDRRQLGEGVAASAPDDDTAVELVGCGTWHDGHRVAIVDPDGGTEQPPGRIGEIWLSGPSVGDGYWRRPEETEAVFRARLADAGDARFLRTGDLGFVDDGELFVTGRRKDVIVVRGVNHYAEDIERTASTVEGVRSSGCAAFGVDLGTEEALVLVCEIEWGDLRAADRISTALRAAVTDAHGLAPHAVVLVEPRSLPKTSSGKLQRGRCRDRYLADCLDRLHLWRDPAAAPPVAELSARNGTNGNRPHAEPSARRRRRRAPQPEPIAIVGLSCRFPGSANVDEFRALLRDGRHAITEIPRARWDGDEFYDPTPGKEGKSVSKWGGFVDGLEDFEPELFGISPGEADRMDPQQRLAMEVAWEALESANLPLHEIAGAAGGVYVGISTVDVIQRMSEVPLRLRSRYMGPHAALGAAHSIAANRLSYVLNLTGPSMAIDTACSSSLVGVHLACKSLNAGETDLALAGGVAVLMAPDLYVALSSAYMLSPHGRSRSFDAKADGYVRGEGCGFVVLKRLSDAVERGDRIFAVIRGSAVNQDGATNGLTAPNPASQRKAIQTAFRDADIKPDDVGYVEAHGTGTPVGDPIEMHALAGVMRAASPGHRCWVGSAKANVGHLEAAAGMAGLVKAILAVQYGEIYPQPLLEQLNPAIRLDGTPIAIPDRLRRWSSRDRTAAVNSFGFGGTNAHVVVSAPPPRRRLRPRIERPAHLLTLSARTESSLKALASSLGGHVRSRPDDRVEDVCHTANRGRTRLGHRAYLVTHSREHLLSQLDAFAGGGYSEVEVGRVRATDRPHVAFLYTGQGAQYPGMGRLLYETQPAFRDALDRCARIARGLLDVPLIPLLHDDTGLLDRTRYTQPALFALEYALTEMWRSWGVRPDVVMGHSIGEYAAACAAGVFTVEEGLRLVIERGRLIDELPPGAMAAVMAPEDEVIERLAGRLDEVRVAAVNGPAATTISGDEEAVRDAVALLTEHGVTSHVLRVSHAFHSKMMEPALDPFESAASRVAYRRPELPIVSNLTGSAFDRGYVPTARYWREQMRLPVRFADGMQTLAESGVNVFLEIGPSPALISLGRVAAGDVVARWISSLRQQADDWHTVLHALGELVLAGVGVDWEGFDRGYSRQLIDLPTYPFERSRSQLVQELTLARDSTMTAHPLLGWRNPSADYSRETRLTSVEPEYLGDHCVDEIPVMPAAGYVEMALGAGREIFGGGAFSVRELALHQMLLLPQDDRRLKVQLIATELSPVGRDLRISSAPGDSAPDASWKLHAGCRVQMERPRALDDATDRQRLKAVRERCAETVTGKRFYREYAESGLQYGPAFQAVRRVWRRDTEAFGRLVAPERVAAELEDHLVHPALLDAVFQVFGAALPWWSDDQATRPKYLPIHIDRVEALRPLKPRSWAHATLGFENTALADLFKGDESAFEALRGKVDPPEFVQGDADLLDDYGRVLVSVKGLRLKRVDLEAGAPESRKWLYSLTWEPVPEPEAAETPTEQDEEDEQPFAPSDPKPPGEWILVGRDLEDAAAPAAALQGRGAQCTLVGGRELDAVLEHSEPEGVAIVAGVRAPLDGVADPGDLAPDYARTLEVLQSLARHDWQRPPRLWLVTRGAQSVIADADVVDPRHATLWGLGSVMATEHPDLRPSLLDLPSAATAADLDAAVGALLDEAAEDRLAIRDGAVHRQRLTRRDAEDESDDPVERLELPDADAVRLEIGRAGRLDRLVLTPLRRRPAILREVEIEIKASGLNFRDVMAALGIYPSAPGQPIYLGHECSGIVSRLGPDVQGLEIGDPVMGFAPLSLATHASTVDVFVVRRPDGLSFVEAATVPLAYATALYGLKRLANVSPGERVLIHAAAGGVGMAAIHTAHALGAEVFATAGTDEKRELVRSMGVAHVMDSRTLDFADEIMALTDGQGVDVALNSLAGEAIEKTLGVLRVGGRFVEIGKADIYQNSVLHLAPFRHNLAFFAVDLDELFRHRPAVAGELLRESAEMLEAGQVKPLRVDSFPLTEAPAAFRHMSKARHIGKVVLVPEDLDRRSDTDLDPGGSYLITGGLGTLGLKTARLLVERGARHVVLAGRRAPSDDAAAEIEALRAAGADVVTRQVDVGDSDQVRALIEEIETSFAPLRGVFHLAAVLEDGLLVDQSWERAAKVMHAKALGAWNLHRHTADRALTHFVLFSSSTAFIAGPGHGPYAAANAFLDGLSHYRHSLSLPATSIEWGFWSGLGIAAGSQSEAQLVESGVGVIPADTGIEILDRLLAEPAAVTAVLPCDWEKLGTTLHSVAGRPLFAKLLADRPAERLAAARAEILSVPPVERVAYVQNYVVRELARVMQLEPDEIDVDKPLNQLGMDSLMGLELKSRWEGDFKTKLPISELVESPTIAELSVKLVKLVENPEIAAAAQEAGGEDAEEQLKAALSQLEDASGDELEALLTQRGPSSNGTGHAYCSVDLAWLERASEPQIARRLQAIAQPSTTKPPSAEAPPPTAAPAPS